MNRLCRVAAGAALAVLGCGSPKAPEVSAKSAAAAKPLHLRIESSKDANGGTALHMLVRKTKKTDYPRQEYDDVAASLLLDSDPDTLEWVVLSPGRTHDVWVRRPADDAVGVYFLFSDPGVRWRELLADPSIEFVHFRVGRDQIREAHLGRAALRAAEYSVSEARGLAATGAPGEAPREAE